MDKPTPPAATEGERRVYPLRTGKIRLTKGTASEIARAVGVRPSEAKFAKKLLRLVDSPRPKAAASKTVVTKKPSRSSK